MTLKKFDDRLMELTASASNRQLREANTYALGMIMMHVNNIDKLLSKVVTGAVLAGAFYCGWKTMDKILDSKEEKTDEE